MMKKLFSLILGFAATSFMASSQTCADFVAPANTGANMTIGVNASKFDQFSGSLIGAFYDLNGDGTLQCVGLETIQEGFFGLALWGDDPSTPSPDGLTTVSYPQFALCIDGQYVINLGEIPQFTGYVTNGIVNITDACLAMDYGMECVDPDACNASPLIMYDLSTTNGCGSGIYDYSSCDYYSCLGCMDASACNYNPDATIDDGSCDYHYCFDCTDASACNYNAAATQDDGLCIYADYCDECSGETDGTGQIINLDCDGDGVCDQLEIIGCQDASACNYNADATDGYDCSTGYSAYCVYPSSPCETCDYGEIINNDADGDGVCDPDEIVGCQNPSAGNYNPAATDQAEAGSELACVSIDPNWAPATDEENTSIVITSNNMSILFPVNNAGLWNTDQSNLLEGDIIGALFETGRLENNFLDYSEISGLYLAGTAYWTGDQIGLAIFGADNMINNGFQPGEDLKWLVQRDGVAYYAAVTYATPGYNGTYQEGTYVTVNSIVLGAPLADGCTDPRFMEYNPLATNDDGSCSTFISVGCMDANFVNYAAGDVDANAIHDNSNNFGDAFIENYTIDLTTGVEAASGVAAIFHDVDVCQTKVSGCTYPFASNYDSQATEEDGSCDWSAYSHHTFDAVTGVNTGTLYSFGRDDDDSNNEWVGSDFEYANDLYQDARMGTGHIVTDLIASYDAYTERRKADSTFLSDTLIDVAAWFAADEAADAQELANLIDIYNALLAYTLDSAAVAFAADEAADAQELSDSLNDNYARHDYMLSHMEDSVAFTLDSAAIAFAADEAADELFLNQTIADYEALLAQTIYDMQAAYDANDAAHIELESLITDSLNYHRNPIQINLKPGWNTVAYYLQHESPVVAQFEEQFGSEQAVQENINIVKNNEGEFYWPAFLFDALGMMIPGQGYQVRVSNESDGKHDFIFTHEINADNYRELTPTLPQWALDMDVEIHPNDIRSLVRIINMLGQEVDPERQIKGTVLLYLYNDATVEKKIVE